MKKAIILSCILLSGIMSAKAAEVYLPPSLGGIQDTGFQMRLMEEQRFRQDEYNEYKEMQPQKEERNRKLNLQEKFEKDSQSQTPAYTPDVNLIRENGQLKLKSIE